MLTPTGQPAGSMDRIMLLADWTKHLQQEVVNALNNKKFISAGMGKPTFPFNQKAARAGVEYMSKMAEASENAGKIVDIKEKIDSELNNNNLNISNSNFTPEEISFLKDLPELVKFYKSDSHSLEFESAEQKMQTLSLVSRVLENKIVNAKAASDYGNPLGDYSYRHKIAEAFAQWYEVKITAKNVIFTPGGAGAIHVICEALDKINQKENGHKHGKIVTQIPYYTLYAAGNRASRLCPIELSYNKATPIYISAQELQAILDKPEVLAEKSHVLIQGSESESGADKKDYYVESSKLLKIGNVIEGKKTFLLPGFDPKKLTITAEALEKAILKAKQDVAGISYILICDPNNPLGTYIDEEELQKIAAVLKKHPGIPIVLDEAYAEMRMDGKYRSLLTIAPELADRIILMRSATKALSAAGQRMAVTITSNESYLNLIKSENIEITGHVADVIQAIYSEAMHSYDEKQRQSIVKFYKPQVEYAAERLMQMGALFPHPGYKPDGAFYVLADLHELKGRPLSQKVATEIFGYKNWNQSTPPFAQTDEHIIYSLLEEEHAMVAPLSYYGWDPKSGYIRITCSTGRDEIGELMDRIEARLFDVRLDLRKKLISNLEKQFQVQKDQVSNQSEDRGKKVQQLEVEFQELKTQQPPSALEAKKLNEKLKDLKVRFAQVDPDMQYQAASQIKATYKMFQERKILMQLREKESEQDLNEKIKHEQRETEKSKTSKYFPKNYGLRETMKNLELAAKDEQEEQYDSGCPNFCNIL